MSVLLSAYPQPSGMREMRPAVSAMMVWPMPPAVVVMPTVIGAIIMTVVVVMHHDGAMVVPAVMMVTRFGIGSR